MKANWNLPPGCTGYEETFRDAPIVSYECEECGHSWPAPYWPDGEKCRKCGKKVQPNDD